MHLIGTPLRRLLVAVGVSCAYNFLINAGVVHEAQFANAALYLTVPMFFVWWVQSDARRTGYWPSYHYGLWLYLLGFVLVPHYVLRTRGRPGVPVAAGMLVLAILPLLFSWVGILVYEHVPESLWLEE